LSRLTEGAQMSPFLLGDTPLLPDFHLFHILQLGKTFSRLFDIPFLNMLDGDEVLQRFCSEINEPASTIIDGSMTSRLSSNCSNARIYLGLSR